MANIFKQQKEVNNHPNRNNFDLSFQNHLTMKMGTLYPVFCKEVVPGDSFRINSAFGLKFMPLVFPTQTRMRANMHFFYVRNKNIWKDWENWVSGLKTTADGVVHPYISQDGAFFKSGTLADYLNVPTSLAVDGSAQIRLNSYNHSYANEVQAAASSFTPFDYGFDSSNPSPYAGAFPCSSHIDSDYWPLPANFTNPENADYISYLFGWYRRTLSSNAQFYLPLNGDLSALFSAGCVINVLTRPSGDGYMMNWSIRSHYSFNASDTNSMLDAASKNFEFAPDSAFIEEWNDFIGQGLEVAIMFSFSMSDLGGKDFPTSNWIPSSYMFVDVDESYISDTDYQTPFSKSADAVRISALPFRAYESVVRCYYKNQVIQPLIVNGVEEYNRYNTTVDGGADTTPYHLEKRNYELDYLTSCLPSPQQGNTPLVGFNILTGTMTLESEDGITTAKVDVDNNGNITGLNVTSPIAGKDHALTLADIASLGMNINDFRNSNALLHWLETNIRKGYRYIDFISGHFGKSPKYNELDLPEFIGGFSRDVTVSQIVSNADTLFGSGDSQQGASLGSYVGMANCFGGSKHSITHYCDDYGFIIGILSVVPTPSYSQLLPKHFLKYSPLDYYFPEFSQLGMQPISYEEVCPVQAYNEYLADNTKKLTDTFGYQRPNYDLVSYVDEIHGTFRNSLSNFLINRVFSRRPVLGNDFLQIDPDETNQIFLDQSPDQDNIIGQVIFDVKAKRPVPRVVIPGLGH